MSDAELQQFRDAARSPSRNVGSLVAAMDGTILEASGECDSGSEAMARAVGGMVQDASSVLASLGRSDRLRRVTVAGGGTDLVATVSGARVFVMKLRDEKSSE
eukprot:EC714514.1.p1 GENE.EC714514.1~~EC714514.1.p1  ORF type:complete len:103 (+),score=9.58 EC714514.1:2-310(+)